MSSFITPAFLNTVSPAIMMFMMNITGNQIAEGLTNGQRKILQSPYVRWVAILAVFYVGTKNAPISLIMTLITVIILDVLLNEYSRFYLFRRQNTDGKIRSIGSGASMIWNDME